jgi:hypothetical protein
MPPPPKGTKQKKFCVFCGAPPKNKNKEHIIPKWLIQLTGKPNRKAPLSINKSDWSSSKHSFSTFTFPACEKCNSEFSALEGKAKHVVISLLEDSEISENELSLFLDWIDKVRIGLWLGDMLRNPDQNFVQPNFHISDRIGQKDRAVFFLKTDDDEKGIGYTGTATLAFHFVPSCFGLIINNLYILNVSSDFLFSHRLGFPLYKGRFLDETTGKVGGKFSKGRGKPNLPILPTFPVVDHVSLFQPNFPVGIVDTREFSNCIPTDFLNKNTLDQKQKGRVFLTDGCFFGATPDTKSSLNLKALKKYDRYFLHNWFGLTVLKKQLELVDKIPRIDHWSEQNRKYTQTQIRMSRKINLDGMNHFKKELSFFTRDGKIKNTNRTN